MGSKNEYSTPLIPASSASFIAHATTRINAPAALVFRTVRNTETWKDWNRFTPKVTIKNQPEEDDATDAEYRDLVMLNTSRALSIDSDIASSHPPPPPPPKQTEQRRASSAGLSSQSSAQKYAELQAGRRASVASNASTSSKVGANLGTVPEVVPTSDEHIFSHPSAHGKLETAPAVQPSQSTPATPTKRGSVSAAPKRRLSINAIYGEPSVRLIVGTTMTIHACMKLPQHPNDFKEYAVVVTEVIRPDDPTDPLEAYELLRSHTHMPSPSGVYRIVWGSENGILDVTMHRYPKFMLQFQRVTEVRSVFRGDGKEESEVKTWEAWKGLASKKLDKAYVQKWLGETTTGLKDFCETFGGSVDRRDFVQ